MLTAWKLGPRNRRGRRNGVAKSRPRLTVRLGRAFGRVMYHPHEHWSGTWAAAPAPTFDEDSHMRKQAAEYQPKFCETCGKRIPRWVGGKQTRSDQRFCSAKCGNAARGRGGRKRAGRTVARVRRDNREKVPVNRAFPEPVQGTEGRPAQPESMACWSCGRSFSYRGPNGDASGRFCSANCRACFDQAGPAYGTEPVPRGSFRIVGPADCCAACQQAIEPQGPQGLVMPYRVGANLYHWNCLMPAQRKRFPLSARAYHNRAHPCGGPPARIPRERFGDDDVQPGLG
jgi:hypothetical protein